MVFPARNFLLVMLLLTLVGCSSTTFIYNRLDFILPWYLDDYVDLNNEQDAFLDEQLAPFLPGTAWKNCPVTWKFSTTSMPPWIGK